MNERYKIPQGMGPLLESFTGEHVGEPRLLICLFGFPLLHVDLKFVSQEDIIERVEDPIIIWEHDSYLSKGFTEKEVFYPSPDLEWIEKRFWIWIHYIAGKIGRGEIFQSIEGLGFLRSLVLGPMVLLKSGARPQGVRRIEEYGQAYIDKLKLTIPKYDSVSCFNSLRYSIELLYFKDTKISYCINCYSDLREVSNLNEKRTEEIDKIFAKY